MIAAFEGYEKILRKEKEGKGTLNRLAHTTLNARRWKRMCGRSSWFRQEKKAGQKNGKCGRKRKREGDDQPAGSKRRKKELKAETVLFIPYTPKSELKQQVQEAGKIWLSNPLAGRVKVVEKLGPMIKDLICNPTPWKTQHCRRSQCPPCRTKVGACKARNVTYRLECKDCQRDGVKSSYWGETSRTFFDRAVEHEANLTRGEENSPLRDTGKKFMGSFPALLNMPSTWWGA